MSTYDFVPPAVRAMPRIYDFLPADVRKAASENEARDDHGRWTSGGGGGGGGDSAKVAEERKKYGAEKDRQLAEDRAHFDRYDSKPGKTTLGDAVRARAASAGRGALSGGLKGAGVGALLGSLAAGPGGGLVGSAAGAALGAVVGGGRGLLHKNDDTVLRVDMDKGMTDVFKSLTTPGAMKQGLVYGWASVIEKNGKVVTDHQGDRISVDELTKAAHDYMSNSRIGGAMHMHDSDKPDTPLSAGEVVESMVMSHDLQKALGIDLGRVGWLIGYRIDDEHVRKAAASGTLPAFSIGGKGVRSAAHGD
jgi:hypothetical protein